MANVVLNLIRSGSQYDSVKKGIQLLLAFICLRSFWNTFHAPEEIDLRTGFLSFETEV